MTLIEALRGAFLTSISEGGKYYLSLKYPTMQEMHDTDSQLPAFLLRSRVPVATA